MDAVPPSSIIKNIIQYLMHYPSPNHIEEGCYDYETSEEQQTENIRAHI